MTQDPTLAEQEERGAGSSVSARLARGLDAHAAVVVAVVLVLTAILALPFVFMVPTSTSSQEPQGDVFDARTLLAERLPSPLHHMVFVIEARDGNILDKSSLLELLTRVFLAEPLCVGGTPRKVSTDRQPKEKCPSQCSESPCR